MGIELNQGLKQAVKLITDWYLSGTKQVFELSGAGGTGKSTAVKFVQESVGLSLDEIAFVTFTGKASLVLTMKGTPATTIHKLIYRIKEETVVVLDKGGNPVIENGVVKTRIKQSFVKVKKIPDEIKLIVADECGMINQELWDDLLSFDKPILVLGDPYQLPPVNGKSPLLQNPDFELWEIMRQAEGNPIIKIATLAREGKPIPYGRYGNKCAVIKRSELSDDILTKADIVVSCTNKSREEINRRIRSKLGRDSMLPSIGDKIICRKNNWNLECSGYPLINGMIGYVSNEYGKESINTNDNSFVLDFQPDFLSETQYFNSLKADYRPFTSGTKTTDIIKERFNFNNLFEYGYCITTHLSQGSAWNKVIFHADTYPFRGKKYEHHICENKRRAMK